MDNNSYRKIACPSCGAPLLIDPDADTTRCTFCGMVIQWPKKDKHAPAKPEPADVPAVPTSIDTSRRQSSGPLRAIPALALLLSLCGVVALGLIVWLVVGSGSPNSILKSPITVNGPTTLLQSDPASPPDVIALGYDAGGDQYHLARLSPAGRKTVWRGKAFDDISAVSGIAAAGDAFFTVEGTVLHAYNAADGGALWQADLPDKLGYCDECLSVSGNRVIVLTQDYTLQAFDTESGEAVWTRRMAGYTEGFQIVGDTLLVLDEDPGKDYSLMQLNLSNGNVWRQITPECKGEEVYSPGHLDTMSKFVLDPNSAGTVYLFYGFSTSCIERWDLASGTMLWQSVNEKGYSPSQDYSILLTPSTLYFAYDNFLWATETETGKTRLVTQMQDYEPVPLAFSGGRLIVRVKRTRGTTQFGLWGMDPTQGEKIWQRVFATGVPLDPPDKASGLVDSDQSVWTYRMADGQLIVLEFQAQPYQLKFTTIDPQTGSAKGEKTLKLKMTDDYFVPTILGWRDPVVWMVIDSGIYGIDIGAATISYSYP